MAALPMLMGMMGQGQQQDQQRLASVNPGAQQQSALGGAATQQPQSGGSVLSSLAQLGQNAANTSQNGAGNATQPVPNPTSNQTGGSDFGSYLMKMFQAQGN